MTNELTNILVEVMPQFEGFVYPNEATQHPLWSVLIVLYPYITGLVAGGASLANRPAKKSFAYQRGRSGESAISRAINQFTRVNRAPTCHRIG